MLPGINQFLTIFNKTTETGHEATRTSWFVLWIISKGEFYPAVQTYKTACCFCDTHILGQHRRYQITTMQYADHQYNIIIKTHARGFFDTDLLEVCWKFANQEVKEAIQNVFLCLSHT